MSGDLPITVIVPTRNEVANIRRCIGSLRPAQRIVVVDSGSDDGTVPVAQSEGAEVIEFRYRGGYPKKRQWALETVAIRTPWVLLVDADETIPDALWKELATATQQTEYAAYTAIKSFHFLGQQFRFGGFSHAAVILFRRGMARFERLLEDAPRAQDMEVHERLIVDGVIGRLKMPLLHEDFKGLDAYIDRHNKYSTWEALVRLQYLTHGTWGAASIEPKLCGDPQQLRRLLKAIAVRVPFEPQLWFLYHYVLRLGFLQGRAGLIASRLRANYIADVRAKMYEIQKRISAERRDSAHRNASPALIEELLEPAILRGNPTRKQGGT